MATPQYDDGPEVAPQPYPEVIPQQTPTPSHAYSVSTTQAPTSSGGYAQSPPNVPSKVDDKYAAAVPVSAATAPGPQYQQYPPHYYNPLASQEAAADGGRTGGDENGKPHRKGPFGCTLLVFVLSAIIAILAAAVIGLAAGTGIEANRATNALASLAELSAHPPATTVTVGGPAATAGPASFASIDNNCSVLPDTVTGTLYTSFQLLGQQTFTIHCNKDTQGTPLLSLFAADFDTCMDACSGYSKYASETFGAVNSNTTCGGVSFIPLWTTKDNATIGGAPGNCYLKPSPQNATNLPAPNIGTECHAAVLKS